MKLYQFIAIVTVVMMLLSQLPTFHSLRHINLGSLILCLGFSFLTTAACIYAGKYSYPSSFAILSIFSIMQLKTIIYKEFGIIVQIIASIISKF